MWGKMLCFVGGAAVAYLAREQIDEAIDWVWSKANEHSRSNVPATTDSPAALEADAVTAPVVAADMADQNATA